MPTLNFRSRSEYRKRGSGGFQKKSVGTLKRKLVSANRIKLEKYTNFGIYTSVNGLILNKITLQDGVF